MKITLAITGASGFSYGLRLLECLVKADCEISVLMSQAAHAVASIENGLKFPGQTTKLKETLCEMTDARDDQLQVYSAQEWTAPIASGSSSSDAMVVCPCSAGTLSAIAVGASSNLIERAADVMLKERQPLILVPREMPLSSIHLQNMLTLSQQGVVIMPASPGFYHQPKTIDDLVDFVVARILKQLGIKQDLVAPWGEDVVRPD